MDSQKLNPNSQDTQTPAVEQVSPLEQQGPTPQPPSSLDSTIPTNGDKKSLLKSKRLVIAITIIGLIILSTGAYWAFFNFPRVAYNKMVADCISKGGAIGESYPPTCVHPSEAPDPTADWETYEVIRGSTNTPFGIQYKLPPQIPPPNWGDSLPSYVPSCQETVFPNATFFGICLLEQQYLSLTYDLFVNQLKLDRDLTISPYTVDGFSGYQFFGPIYNPKQSPDGLVVGGGNDRFRGSLLQIDEEYFLYTFHFQPGSTPENETDFELDDIIFKEALSTFKFVEGEGVACTQEAMLCPDGSSVGRSGPNCEFSPCPMN